MAGPEVGGGASRPEHHAAPQDPPATSENASPGAPAIGGSGSASYRQLADNLPGMAVHVYDRDLRFTLAGGEALRQSGLDPRWLEGKILSETVSAKALEVLEPAYRAALEGTSLDFDFVSPVTGRTFRTRIRPVADDETGAITGGLVVAEDVTEQRQREAELGRTQAFDRAVLTASPDVIVIMDLPGGEVRWSSRQLPGLPDHGAGAPGAPPTLSSLAHPDDQLRLRVANLAVLHLADGEDLPIRYRVRAHGGQYRWLSLRLTPFQRNQAGLAAQAVGAIHDVTAVVENEEQLVHAALHDPLTGLANRKLLEERITLGLARARRTGGLLAALFIDLDGFKEVNDTAGHDAGDAVLLAQAQRLLDTVRETDTVARASGDEFVIVLEPSIPPYHDDPRQTAIQTAHRVRSAIAAPITYGGVDHEVTASIGIAFGRLDSTAANLIGEADLAMYQAKQRGKDRHRIYGDIPPGGDVPAASPDR